MPVLYDNTISPNIEIVQGATKDFYVWFTDSSNNGMDLTGYTGGLYAKAFRAKPSDPVDISVGLTILDASSGQGMFSFTSLDTSVAAKDYKYQIELYKASDGKLHITDGDKLTITDRVK